MEVSASGDLDIGGDLLIDNITLPISKKVVTIRESNGHMDNILTQRGKDIYTILCEYMAALVLSIDGRKGISKKDIMDLCVFDIEAINLKRFVLTYGDDFRFDNACGSCGAESSHSVNLSNVVVKEIDPNFLPIDDPVIKLILPRTKKAVTVGILNGHKQLILSNQLLSGKVDLNQADYLAIREFDGSPSFSYEEIVSLPSADHRAIRAARGQLIGGYDTVVSWVCPSCANHSSFNLLMHRDFLFPMR